MLFSSYQFIFVYLPIVWLGFCFLSKMNMEPWVRVFLLVSSLFFYAYWDYRLLPLLLLSILFNYIIGKKIINIKSQLQNSSTQKIALLSPIVSALPRLPFRVGPRQRVRKGYAFPPQSGSKSSIFCCRGVLQLALKSKTFLAFGVSVNIFVLFFFKYFSFFVNSLNDILSLDLQVPEIILPLGISFFTFTQIAFLVDAYKNQAERADLYSYGLFVTIFPHLIAGPILHHKAMIRQFNSQKMFQFDLNNLQVGVTFFIVGLCKKVLIADRLSHMVTPIFDHQSFALSVGNTWFGTLAYTFQLYFDFSGYSDMAIGLGKMFNIELPINFNSPYKATSISEFWKRWHITLSQFLKDYLYIPLGGNRNGKGTQLRNLFLTMFLGGIWHGAGFTYMIWGALHGLYLIINHIWKALIAPLNSMKIPALVGWALTFVCVAIGWVFFRAPTLAKAWQVLSAMCGHSYPGKEEFFPSIFQLISFVPIAFATFFLPNSRELIERIQTRTAWAIGLGIGLAFSLISFDKTSEFLYFQF